MPTKCMREFLESVDCIDFLKCFTTMKKSALANLFKRYVIEEARAKIKRLLPATREGRKACTRIVNALTKSDSESDEEEVRPQIKDEIKEEVVTEEGEAMLPDPARLGIIDAASVSAAAAANGGNSNEAEAMATATGGTKASEESEDEIEIIHEVLGDVSFAGFRVKREEENETIEIEIDDEEEVSVPNAQEAPSIGSNSSILAPELPSSSSLSSNVPSSLTPARKRGSKKRVRWSSGSNTDTPVATVEPLEKTPGRKTSFASTFSVSTHWTWMSQGARSTSNLYQMLCRRPNIVELNIEANASDDWDEIDQPFDGTALSLTLPKLKRLKIRHSFHINYGPVLRQIIAAASGLESIEVHYLGENSLRIFLSTLKDMEETQLQSLKFLTIEEALEDNVSVVSLELELLSQIKARNLEKLSLGLYFWYETKLAFEAVLRNFAHLKHLTLKGCFNSDLEKEPKISVAFPAMPQLEVLDLGKQYKFDTVFETIDAVPKRRRSSIRVRQEAQDDIRASPAPSRKKARRNEEEDDDSHGYLFPITLDMPAMPKLKSIMLGAFYEIKDLHFARFPSLTTFQVSSPWHLSVKFPSAESRHRKYPLVTELQLPDALQDHTFVAKVATHFPNVESYWINLPSVKVLRAFAKAQLSLSPLKLKALDLKVRFDFRSSLDWAFLEKPSKQRAFGKPQSAEEIKTIAVFKAYEHWESYAKEYQIEIPNADDLMT